MSRHTIPIDSTESGFSLLEIMASLTVIVVMVLALQGSLLSSVQIRQSNSTIEIRQHQAYDFVQRLMTIPFGTVTDPTPTSMQLSELFDGDQDLGNITLKQIEVSPTAPGQSFTTLMEGVTTNWRVAVSNDLDSDGKTLGPREGRTDLLQIQVFANNTLMFQTIRAADVPNTVKD